MINTWLRRQLQFLASARLALFLLAILAALFAVYLLVPQDPRGVLALKIWVQTSGFFERVARAIGLTDVLHSRLLFFTYGLLFVNLTLCMLRRFPMVVRSCRIPKKPPRVSPRWLHREASGTQLETGDIIYIFRKKGYRPLVRENNIYGLRGRFTILGHYVFHLSLLMLLASGMWVAAAPAPFRGAVGIGEGEPFDLHKAPYLSQAGSPSRDLPELRFRMEKIEVVTEGSEVRQFEARLSTQNGEQLATGINRPYRKRPYQVLVTGFGYMPGWVMVNQRGRMVGGAWVKLLPFPKPMEDSFPIGPEESKVDVRFFPDYQSNGDGPRNAGYHLRNPRFDTKITWHGEQVFAGLLKPGEKVPLSNGWQFFFTPEIRKYGILDVMQEQGHEIIFVALGIMVLGILIRYGRIRKEILVRVEAESLQIYGRSDILKNLFAEELERLAKDLKKKAPPPQD